MAKSRHPISHPDMSPNHSKGRDCDSMSRWSEYLNTELSYSSASISSKHSNSEIFTFGGACQKGLNMEWVVQLSQVADGLMAKIYKLNQMLDFPDPVLCVYSDSFWKAGVIPNYPKLCILLAKKFPEHPSKLQLERVDKFALDALYENAESYFQHLEPWVMLLLDLMVFREQALRLILDVSSTVITLLPHQNSLILHAFMDLFCSFVRLNLFSDKMPRKMMIQLYNLLHIMLKDGRDSEFYHRLVQFIDSYDPPLKGLQEDLNFVSPRIGEVLEAVGPAIFLSTDTAKLRNEGFLSPFHPRYPDILTNSAHPMRAQDLANVSSYREWVLFGFLVCPDELLRVTSIDIAMVVLKENLILPLFRDEYILLHENFQFFVLPRILESKKKAKLGHARQREADLGYNVAKQVEKMICEVHEKALISCDAIHRERRILLKQEISRVILFFTDQPSLLAPNIQMVFSALSLSRCELIWYFQHIGIGVASSKSKGVRVVPIEMDASDPTVGFLLDGMDRICCLVRKYVAAIRGYALSYLSFSAGRIRFLLGTPGMVALDLDTTLRSLFQQIVQCLENVPRPQGENASTITIDLSDLRKDWLSILLIVTSSRSSINIRHLEKATVSTGKEGLLSEGNAVYNWSRCADQLESLLFKHASLRKLYFYNHHLTAVFRNTMFGSEGHPQHCCSWLGVASTFPDCASAVVPEEIVKINRDAVMYVEVLIESIMGGLEGLINILDSDEGFGFLDIQLLPEQAAIRMNHVIKVSSAKSPQGISSFPLPGHESYPQNNNSVKMLEAAVQRLTSLCSVLNDMEPICILNHVFVLREYMRDCILENFRKKLFTSLKSDNDLQRPSLVESMIHRHISVIRLAEQHVTMDLTQGIREILLMEGFCGPISSLHTFDKPADRHCGTTAESICNWFIENIVKDVNKTGIQFIPTQKCFKSTRTVGGSSAEFITDIRELKAFIRLFGGYGVDKLDKMLREHTAAFLNCIATALLSNQEALESVASSINSGDQTERDVSLKQIVDLDTTVGFCIRAGQALCFSRILAEASGEVLEESAPLLFSLLQTVTNKLPDEIPEKEEIKKLKNVASSVGILHEHDIQWVRSILIDVGGSWNLLPYLCAAFMTADIWHKTTFDVVTGGFTNNIYCLARCINAVIAASEMSSLEQEMFGGKMLRNKITNDDLENEVQNHLSVESNVKSAMQQFVKCSAVIVLDPWNENDRANLVTKLIFLDQICELSPYLPRSTFELYIPYSILRSIYRQYYGKMEISSMELLTVSPRRSPAVFLARTPNHPYHQHRSGWTPQSNSDDSSFFKGSVRKAEPDPDQSRARRSGPLDYNSHRKARAGGEGSSTQSRTMGSVSFPRSAATKSGPLPYK